MADLKNLAHVKAVADGNTAFSADLHKALKSEHPGNLIYSPFSLSAVVGMAHAGARANTAQEIKAALKFPNEDEALYQGYSEVLASIQESNEEYTLAAANRLYAQSGFEPKPEFGSILSKSFHAGSEQLDFSKSAESALAINKWVEETTKNKIKNLISPDALGPLTRIVLVNGIYFKGLWENKFDAAHTRKAPFHLDEKTKIEVDMMYKESKFPYTELNDLSAHAVALPYKGDRLRMLIIVPKEVNGLAKIEAGLKTLNPGAIFESMTTDTKVGVTLPRFKLESTVNLVEPLKRLGLKSMFDANAADFSGISDVPLYVSAVIQKALIEVNEEGSEAAAATGMIMMTRCMPIIIPFNANKPFFLQIVDTKTNFVLFSAACTNPSSAVN